MSDTRAPRRASSSTPVTIPPLGDEEPTLATAKKKLKSLADWRGLLFGCIAIGIAIASYDHSVVKHSDLDAVESRLAQQQATSQVLLDQVRLDTARQGERTTAAEDGVKELKEDLRKMDAKLSSQLFEIARTVGAKQTVPNPMTLPTPTTQP